MRQLIKSKNDLDTFVNTLSSRLTRGACAALVIPFITDKTTMAALNNAVGGKANEPMKGRPARDLAALLLNFDNAHTMAAYYNEQRLYTRHSYVYENRHDNSAGYYYTEQGASVTEIDVIAACELGFQPEREDELLTINQYAIDTDVSESDMRNCLKREGTRTGLVFIDPAHIAGISMYMNRGDCFEGIDLFDPQEDHALLSVAAELLDNFNNASPARAGYGDNDERFNDEMNALGRYDVNYFNLDPTNFTRKQLILHLLSHVLRQSTLIPNMSSSDVIALFSDFSMDEEDGHFAFTLVSSICSFEICWSLDQGVMLLMATPNDRRANKMIIAMAGLNIRPEDDRMAPYVVVK